MAIKRYFADTDNTITNAYKSNLTERGISGNMGQSDILETFSIYAQAGTASSEYSRILIKFPMTGTSAGYAAYDRIQGDIPVSGSVSFYLRMFNAKHSQTVPKNYNLVVSAVSQSWTEGNGLDMDNYSDEEASNWVSASSTTSWTAAGGDYIENVSSSFTASFVNGFEDVELDITPLVEQWIQSDGNVLGTKTNYGVGVRLASAEEAATTSYYTKKFFARGSQYYFKRPHIEARWDSSKKDDRGNFYYSSSLAPAEDNLNTLYLYNYVRGQLKNIPSIGTGKIYVNLYSGSAENTEPLGHKLHCSAGGGVIAADLTVITGGHVSTGVYSCSFAYTGSTSLTKIFDVWHSGTNQYFTGTIAPKDLGRVWSGRPTNPNQQFSSHMTNLKPAYSAKNTSARFRLYTRKKDWSPTIYTVSSNEAPIDLVEDVYYKVCRSSDNLEVIPYGTGSFNSTRLSFDSSGSYFDLDMSLLEADDTYTIKFVYYLNSQYVEQSEEFKFRVE